MRPSVFRRVAGLLLVALCLQSPAKMRAAADPATLGVMILGIQETIKQVDNRAASLLQQGNSVAAQQQTLLSGLLTNLVRELEQAYSKEMNSTVDRLMGGEKDVFARLQTSLEDVKRLEGKTAQDVAQVTRQVHAASTEVLSRLPMTSRYPAIHGLLTRDVVAEFDEHPDDIQVLGFFLVDPDLQQLPEVFLNGKKLSKGVSAYFDRIQIQLDDETKSELKFANTACEPRRTFSLWMRVHYNKPRGIWPAQWKTATDIDTNLVASPGDVQYEVTILKSGITSSTGTKEEPFRAESPNFNWGCEENTGNHASFSVPAGHTVTAKNAGWADLGGRWENHGCSVSTTGAEVVGECHVRGGNSNHLVFTTECPGGGHGRVAVWGTTTHQETKQEPFREELVGRRVMRGAERYDTVALGEGQSISAIKIEVRRINAGGRCEKVFDSVEVNLEPELKNLKKATSTLGMFDVETDGRQVSIRRR